MPRFCLYKQQQPNIIFIKMRKKSVCEIIEKKLQVGENTHSGYRSKMRKVNLKFIKHILFH